MIINIKGYNFKKSDLSVNNRKNGISGFLRVKNGAEFIERTIESHIDYFDEIIVVYNNCTDNTEQILINLHR